MDNQEYRSVLQADHILHHDYKVKLFYEMFDQTLNDIIGGLSLEIEQNLRFEKYNLI